MTHPDIRPVGYRQKDIVDLLYQIVSSIKGICAKLDADGSVTDETYEANAYTAIIKTVIEDSKSNTTGTARDKFISPYGIDDQSLLKLLYQLFDSFETLTEQLDADGGVSDTDHEELCYEAKFLGIIEDGNNSIGNGTTFYFKAGGVQVPQLIDLLYNMVDAIETLTEQLDAGGGVSDTNYEALWYTANITTTIEDSQGSVLGN